VELVTDHSGSLRRKLTDVIAARTFVRSSNQEDQMSVVNFNEIVTMGVPGAIRFTNRADALESARATGYGKLFVRARAGYFVRDPGPVRNTGAK